MSTPCCWFWLVDVSLSFVFYYNSCFTRNLLRLLLDSTLQTSFIMKTHFLIPEANTRLFIMKLGFTWREAESMDITPHLCATLTDIQISRVRVCLWTDWQHHTLAAYRSCSPLPVILYETPAPRFNGVWAWGTDHKYRFLNMTPESAFSTLWRTMLQLQSAVSTCKKYISL